MSAATKNKAVTFVRPTDPSPSDLPETFIDRYAKWASSLTDAPTQYHRATGVAILSTCMTPYISFPTSFGTFIPNIWVMVLAGTTMTRKSTSLDIARRLMDDVMDDYMLATDGSPEGLLTEMGYRDGKVSVFHRDEITGFMSAVAGRDYLSGLLESFTRLYDGQPETRILRKERIEIKKPYLIFMAGGIKTRMEELVGMEHVRSGFLPRFIFVTGTTTRDQVRPISRPERVNESGETPRDSILNELWAIHQHYTNPPNQVEEGTPLIKIGGITKVSAAPKQGQTQIKLEGTDEFWDRLVELNADAMELGEKSSEPELYTPLYQRLANSVLKVAMLICGAEFRTEMTVTDLQKAIALSQEWVDTVTQFATAIEQRPDMDRNEKKLDKIVNWIRQQDPNPVDMRSVMNKFRIRKNEMMDMEETLVARGQIAVSPWPHKKDKPGTEVFYSVLRNEPKPRSKIDREDTYRATQNGHAEEGVRNGRRIRFPIPANGDEETD